MISIVATSLLDNLHLSKTVETILIFAFSIIFRLHRCIDIAVGLIIEVESELVVIFDLVGAPSLGGLVGLLLGVIGLIFKNGLFWRAFYNASWTAVPAFDALSSCKLVLNGG